MGERWKFVRETERRYQVSDRGRVRHARLKRVLKSYEHTEGYRQVTLSLPSGQRTRYVHHLVARAFIGKRPKRHVIDHKDTDRQNNVVTNLEFITHEENARRRDVRLRAAGILSELRDPRRGQKHTTTGVVALGMSNAAPALRSPQAAREA